MHLPYTFWDYIQRNSDLSWVVARAFRDADTGEVYFVNQFPPRFKEDYHFSITYSDGRTETALLGDHAFDPEVKFILSSFSRTAQTSPSCTESEEEGKAHPSFS